MAKEHQYNTQIAWTGNRGSGTMDYRSYERDYTIKINEKPDIAGSSDSAFNGDKSRHNPEDLLVASASSCHMLWYLHLCSVNGIVVLEYTDNAYGLMQEEADGSGRFTKIILRPEVTISIGSNKDLAQSLHEEARKMCFIANSLNFPVEHEVTIKS